MKYRIRLTAGPVTQWFKGWRPDLTFTTALHQRDGWFNEKKHADEMAEKVKKHLLGEWDEGTVVTVVPDEPEQLTKEEHPDKGWVPALSQEEDAQPEPDRFILRLRKEGTHPRYFKGLNDEKQVVLSVGPKSAKVVGVEEATEMAGECLNQLGEHWIVDALSPAGRYLFTVGRAPANPMFAPLFTDEELAQLEKELDRMTVAQVEEAQEAVKQLGEQIDTIKGMLFRALPKKIAQETGKEDETPRVRVKDEYLDRLCLYTIPGGRKSVKAKVIMVTYGDQKSPKPTNVKIKILEGKSLKGQTRELHPSHLTWLKEKRGSISEGLRAAGWKGKDNQ